MLLLLDDSLYLYRELETVNQALHKAQGADDDAEKAARLAIALPGTAEEHPSHVQQYVADRKRLLADRAQVSVCLSRLRAPLMNDDCTRAGAPSQRNSSFCPEGHAKARASCETEDR